LVAQEHGRSHLHRAGLPRAKLVCEAKLFCGAVGTNLCRNHFSPMIQAVSARMGLGVAWSCLTVSVHSLPVAAKRS
jgi:hypothetical protein